ncbi:ShlB/FhaC/HecB family hemolysin secretion/activation protein [Caballeronia pedi]|uniref:ShlB/FhaC/HecB family hemolysin secretion/activation protein n=1 Tax=Caballeronia pedi TaxID=1777141 RepID=UPI001FCA45E6|nr:ShlB/FhaC/HecB family hemolysin secretion/activation protein [Caballeronia pedi]
MWHTHAQAVEPVNAGTLLRQNADITRGIGTEPGADSTTGLQPSSTTAPPPSADGAFVFTVSDFEFAGALSEAERQRVDAFLAPWRDREVTLVQLQALRDALTAVLYNGGDSLVRVVLPPQTVKGGVVRFEIVRGHVESIDVRNQSRVSTKRLESILGSTSSATPTLREIERNMRFVDGIPGVGTVSSALSTGTTPGGTIVDVDVTPADRFYAAATVDNAGSKQAGWRRLVFSGGANNLLGLGDQLQAIVLGTPRFMQTRAGENGRTRLGRLSYDMLTGVGASRAGLSYSHVDYRLGEAFAGLGSGNADVVSLYGTYPMIRSAGATLDVGASIEARRSTDDRFDNVLESQQRGLVASVRADGSLAGSWLARRNLTQYSAALSGGNTKQKEFDYTSSDSLLDSRSFNFAKFEPAVSYIQSITPTIQLMVSARGQWASRSLDGSQRLGLGGPTAVRAYDQNAAAVDDGIIMSISASKYLRVLPGAALQAFYDDARGRVRDDGMFSGGSVRLQGYGVGASYSGKHIAAQISYAIRAGRPLENSAGHQFWFTLSVTG